MHPLSPEEQINTIKAKEHADNQLRNEIDRFITLQLEGDIDTVRAKQMWLKHLPKWQAASPAITAEALASAIVGKHCIRLSELIKGMRLG